MRYVISWQLMMVLLLLMQAGLVYADKLSEVSEDFLEYLGNLEGTDDNWTDFATKAVAPVVKVSSGASSSKSSVSSKAVAPVQVRKSVSSSTASLTNHAATQPASKVQR